MAAAPATNADAVISELKASNAKTLEALKKDLTRVRAGKATPALVEGLRVSYYGNQSPLNQIGTVSTPDPRTLMIAPWDTTILSEIEKAILASDLGLTPQNDGRVIRINVPSLTEDRRKELSKVVGKLAEENKVSVRQHRKVANDVIKELEKAKALSEDDSKKHSDTIQKATDDAIKQIDDVVKVKTAEIMTV